MLLQPTRESSMLTAKGFFIVSVMLVLTGAAAFGQDPSSSTPSSAVPSAALLEGLGAEAAMNLANAWGMNNDENRVTTWTTSRELHFEFPDGTRTIIPMPDDRMLVSVAPYIMKTHPCKKHFPSACRGELANTPVEVTAVTVDGKVILDQKTRTLPNGFVDLWLPRNLTIDITLKARGLTATQRIGTFDTDKTCITEPKLHP